MILLSKKDKEEFAKDYRIMSDLEVSLKWAISKDRVRKLAKRLAIKDGNKVRDDGMKERDREIRYNQKVKTEKK